MTKNNTITLFRDVVEQALEAFNVATTPLARDRQEVLKAIEALRAALEQPQVEQEPLFWYRPRSDGMYEGPLHNAQIERVRKEAGGWVPLYTRPQPRHPLTDEQVREIGVSYEEEFDDRGWSFEFARAIERAHKIGCEV